jgi:hypothetical protein
MKPIRHHRNSALCISLVDIGRGIEMAIIGSVGHYRDARHDKSADAPCVHCRQHTDPVAQQAKMLTADEARRIAMNVA